MTDSIEVPSPMTLPALQTYVRKIVRLRGFTEDVNQVFILLCEEIGELAGEFNIQLREPHRHDQKNFAFELVDVLLYLLDLANGFNVDLIDLWPEPVHSTVAVVVTDTGPAENPTAADSGLAPGGLASTGPALNGIALNGMVQRAGERAQPGDANRNHGELILLLTEHTGELARAVRRNWRGLMDARVAGDRIVGAIDCVLRLAHGREIDLEAALRAKERINAQRTWDV